MKKWLGGILIVLNISFCLANFVDISDSPYRSEIIQLTKSGVVEGFLGNMFNPGWAITRAELLKIIREANPDFVIDTGNVDCFADVPHHKRYAPYICTAFQQGIIKGYGDETFRPENPILFSEGIKIAIEGFNIKTAEPREGKSRYDGYLEFVHNNNIFSKYNLFPENKMSREQMVHLVAMIINQGEESRPSHRDNRSKGCELNKSPVLPNTIQVNGIDRHIITDVGYNYRLGQPAKLFVAFHGRTNPNSQVRGYYRVDQAGDGNTIFVYPLGLPEEGPTRSRANGGDPATAIRDYALFDKIVEEFSNNYCINLDEIFVIGHSLGAWMTNNLACARGNIIRGIGSVGGSITISPQFCSGPVSAIVIHNPEDNLASFAGGEQARDQLLKQNQCNMDHYSVVENGPEEGHCREYDQCLGDSRVVWCPSTDSIENGKYYPHTRPDFAGSEIWKFLSQL